jgi:hypothetical protein
MKKDMEFSTYYEVIAAELRDALSRYYDKWLEILCEDEIERPQYLFAIEQKRISVIAMTCALLEHAINFYLCTKCNATQFRDLDRKVSFFDKWNELPKTFFPAYRLNKDLARELKWLIRRRVATVHPKPMLRIDGAEGHKGNAPQIALDENSFIESCASMPFRLVENLLEFDSDSFPEMCSVRTTCGVVARELNGARYRFNYAKNIPEVLLDEIIGQGHSRQRARLFATLIGPSPTIRRDRSISVKLHSREIARLKPLKSLATVGFRLDPAELRADQAQTSI